MTYDELITLIPQITHRSDLTPQLQNFINAANEKIETRITAQLQPPTAGIEPNSIFLDQPSLYLYGSLVSAYEFINEIDMAVYYSQRFEALLEQFYINSTAGASNTPVMGDYLYDDTTPSTPTDPTEPTGDVWLLGGGYWSDQGVWVDAAQWID